MSNAEDIGQGKSRGSYGAVIARQNKAAADAFAQSVRPELFAAMTEGSRRPTAVARKLNEKGVLTAGGGKWHAQTVKRVLERLGPEFIEEVFAFIRAKPESVESIYVRRLLAAERGYEWPPNKSA